METITLNAQTRDVVGRSVKTLRTNDQVPAVLYGHGVDNKNVSMLYNDFDKVLATAGESTLVDLVIDSAEPVKVLIHDIQKDSVTDRYTHVDFRQVNMNEKVDAEVPIVFTGVAPAVKERGGIFVNQLDSLHIEALPGDLIHELSIDLAQFTDLGSKLYVRDLQMSDAITILNDPSVVIASVEAQRVEAEPSAESVDEEAALIESRKSEDEKDSGDGDKKEEKKDDN